MTRQLPKNVHLKDGRYYYVKTRKGRATWTPLTRDLESSIGIANALRGTGEARDVDSIRRGLRNSWRAARWRAQKYGVSFELEWEVVEGMADRNGWCCALTGFPFTMSQASRRAAGPFGPSIDRVIPSRGYVDGNVRIICVAINYALNEWGDEFFERLAAAFLKAKGSKTLRLL